MRASEILAYLGGSRHCFLARRSTSRHLKLTRIYRLSKRSSIGSLVDLTSCSRRLPIGRESGSKLGSCFTEISVRSCQHRANIRVAEKFRVGRAFLIGGKTRVLLDLRRGANRALDAAHTHTPAGGQGLNSGMMDVVRINPILATRKNLNPSNKTQKTSHRLL